MRAAMAACFAPVSCRAWEYSEDCDGGLLLRSEGAVGYCGQEVLLDPDGEPEESGIPSHVRLVAQRRVRQRLWQNDGHDGPVPPDGQRGVRQRLGSGLGIRSGLKRIRL